MREREREGERGREGARETKILHTSSGCRSNVLGP